MRPVVRRLVVACTLMASCVVCFGRLTLHPAASLVGKHKDGLNDITEYFRPMRLVQIQSLRDEMQWPFWDPYTQMGRPLAGNPQASAYYPPNWLYPLLGSEYVISWVLVAHHLFGGWGAYLLCRRYGFDWKAALLGGVVFLAAPYFVAQTAEGHYSQCTLAAWLPWALLCFERLRKGRRGSVPLMSLVLAMAFFCGHPQELYYLIVILTVFVLCDMLRRGEDVLPGKQLALSWGAAGLLTLGLVAIDLLPILGTSLQTTRGQGTLAAVAAGGASWENLRQLYHPFALGSPSEMLESGQYYWETLLYVGVVPLLLALVGALASKRQYPTFRYAILFVVCVVFALGTSGLLFTVLHAILPGMSKFRIPSRIMFIAAAVVAVLAAAGLNVLLEQMKRTRLGPRLAGALTASLIAIVVTELSLHAWAITQAVPSRSERTANALAERFANSAADYRVFADQSLLSDEEAIRCGAAKCRGYDPYIMLRYVGTLQPAVAERELVAAESSGYMTYPPDRYVQSVLSLMGVRYLAVPSAGDVDVAPAGWKLVEKSQLAPRGARPDADPIGYALYENENALPRSFVLGNVRTASPRESVAALAQIVPREELLLTNDPLPAGPRQAFAPAQIVAYTPAEVVVEAELSEPGYLVLTDLYAAGWTAQVNGRDVQVMPANLAFRAVPLPAGEHRVVFQFQPPLWKPGAIVSLVSAIVCCWLVGKAYRRDAA